MQPLITPEEAPEPGRVTGHAAIEALVAPRWEARVERFGAPTDPARA